MSTSVLKVSSVGMHLAVIAAAMVCSSSASAGSSIDFQVVASGVYIEQGNKFLIEADVDGQVPDLGFEAFGAVFNVDEAGNPDTFEGFITLTGTLGDLTGLAVGALFQDPGGLSIAGVFSITGGTGAYEGASGSGVLNGLGMGQDAGVMTVNLAGTIGGKKTSTGACCFNDGTCQVLESQECFQQDGSFNAVGTTCRDVECPVTGPCCLPNGNCTVISVQECITSGGAFQGVGASCNGVSCDVTAGPCCFLDMCIESTEDQCASTGGVFQGVGVSCDNVDCGPLCPWDCEPTPEGTVGINDFLEVLAQWSMVGTSCDFDGGGVGINDFLDLLAAWGPCP
jgi:hypothetical protein